MLCDVIFFHSILNTDLERQNNFRSLLAIEPNAASFTCVFIYLFFMFVRVIKGQKEKLVNRDDKDTR